MSWENIVKTVAPMLGTALGGPLGGIATRFISNSLGVSPEESYEDTLKKINSELTSNPDALHKLKVAEINFKKELRRLDIKEEQIKLADVKNARQREIKTGDSTQTWLAFLISIGFFSLLSILIFWEVPADQKNLLNIMVGSLGTAWISIVNYYYGSSSGSARKNELLAPKKDI